MLNGHLTSIVKEVKYIDLYSRFTYAAKQIYCADKPLAFQVRKFVRKFVLKQEEGS